MKYRWLLLSIVGTLAGAGCGASTGQQGTAWSCFCKCETECTIDQVEFIPASGNTPSHYRCTASDPLFGGDSLDDGANRGELQSSVCIVNAQSNQAAADSACTTLCGSQTHEFITLVGGNQPRVRDISDQPDAASMICALAVPARDPVVNGCTVPNGQTVTQTIPAALTAAGNTTAVSMAPQSSQSTITIPVEFGTDVNPVPSPSGTVTFHGGNCPGVACAMVLDAVKWQVPPFTLEGASIGTTTIYNTAQIQGTKAAGGQVVFPRDSLAVSIATTLGETSSVGVLTPDSDLTGSYNPLTGALQLAGTFSQSTGESVSFSLAGQATSRPPVVVVGGSQTVSCTNNGPATVTVDASQSFDPDGGALQFTWNENGHILASTAVATIPLGTGSHTLTVTVKDASGNTAQGTVAVTVAADTVAPQFTFVPPTVMQETSAAAVLALGQATAQDNCGGTVVVTNNAPATFPPGRTVVTWTATDAAGNRATATEDVWVLPSSTAACPPGSHIILGTSNNDVLVGTSGNDCIIGFGGQDHIDGGGGDDVIIGGDGDDILIGGDGNDIVFGGSGQDNITGGAGKDLLGGGDGDDTISGGDGDDTLIGGQGQDHLNGDAGNDVLVGNQGDDTMQGGAGTDRCVADGGHDTLLTCEL